MAHYKPPKGKVSPLDPGKQVKKKKKADAKAAKKAADAKAAKKPAAKKTVVKKTPPKPKAPVPNVKGPGVLGMSATAARAIPYIGAAGVAAAFGVKALSEGFSRITRGGKPLQRISPKTKRIQDLMSKTIGSRKGAGTEIMGGLPLGLQADKAKETVPLTTMPSPVPRPPAKKKESPLGKNLPRLTRAKKEVYTAPLRIPPELPKIVSGGPVPPKPKAVALVPGVKAASGDGPGPTPKSAMRESQIRDFKKYNKSNLLGRSIDDALRGFFSFMGTLPKSTDKDKWKNR